MNAELGRSIIGRRSGRSKARKRVALAIAVGLFTTSCAGDDGGGDGAEAETDVGTTESTSDDVVPGGDDVSTIRIAEINPTTGGAAGFGDDANQGAQLAVDEINQAGGIECLGGATLELTMYDNQSSPDVTSTVAERAVQEGADLMVSTIGSAFTLVAAGVAERNQVPFISDGAQTEQLTAQGYEYVVRTVADAKVVAESDLGLISGLESDDGSKVETIAIMHEDSAYGTSYYDNVVATAPEFGVEVIGEVAYPLDSPDLTNQAQRAGRMGADFIIVAGYPADTALGVRGLYEQNIRPMGIHGATGAYAPEFIDQLGPIASYVFSEAQVSLEKVPGAEPGRPQEVADNYSEAYNEPINAVAAQAYSTPWVIKKALETACSIEADAIMDALHSIEVDGSDGSMLPYTVKFTDNGEVEDASLVQYQVQDGGQVAVWPDDVAVGEPVFPLPENWGN